MPSQLSAPESFSDLTFPASGVDLSQGYMMALPGTTPEGLNVRVYEPLTLRGRGGARPGISKYIPQMVPSGKASLIQHLNIIVDPTTDATLDTFDDGPIDDPSDPGPASAWATGTVTRNPHRKIRRGGHGRAHNKQPKPVKFVQALSNFNRTGFPLPLSPTITLGKPVTAGNLLLVGTSVNADNPALTPGPSDNQGNTYTQAFTVGYTGGGNGFALYWAFASASGTLTATVKDLVNQPYQCCILAEYGNVNPITPVDSVGGQVFSKFNFSDLSPIPVTTGPVNANYPSDGLVAFHLTEYSALGSFQATNGAAQRFQAAQAYVALDVGMLEDILKIGGGTIQGQAQWNWLPIAGIPSLGFLPITSFFITSMGITLRRKGA